MKKIIIFCVVSAAILLGGAAWACRPVTLSISWPTAGQEGVARNARIEFVCLDAVCPDVKAALLDSNGRPVPSAVAESDRPRSELGHRYFTLTPKRDFEPDSAYTVSLKYPDYDVTQSFRTGAGVDRDPPRTDKARIKAEIEWVGDGEAVMLTRPGACGPGEYKVRDAGKGGLRIDAGDRLPEHYNVVLTVDDVTDDTNNVVLRLYEIADDGDKRPLGQFNPPIVSIKRIGAREAGKSKKYELQAEDALGNVQPERIGFQIHFDRSNSSLVR